MLEAPHDTNHDLLWDAHVAKSLVDIEGVPEQGTGIVRVKGKVYVSEISANLASTGEVSGFTLTFKGDGALTIEAQT